MSMDPSSTAPPVSDQDRHAHLQAVLRERAERVVALPGFVWLDGMLPRAGRTGEMLRVIEHGEAPAKRLRAWPDFSDSQTFAVFHGWVLLHLQKTATITERLPGRPVLVQVFRGTDWSDREVVAQSTEDFRVLLLDWCLQRGSLRFPAEPLLEGRPVEPAWFRPRPSARAARRKGGAEARRRRELEGTWTRVELARAFGVKPEEADTLVASEGFPAPVSSEETSGLPAWHPDDVRAWARARTQWGSLDRQDRRLDFSALVDVGDGPLQTSAEARAIVGLTARQFRKELEASTLPRVVLGPDLVRFPAAGLRLWKSIHE